MKRFFILILVLIVQKDLSARLPDLIPYRNKSGMWGYCDSTKKIIIPCKFRDVKPFGNLDSARGIFEDNNVWIRKNGDFHIVPKPSPDSFVRVIYAPVYHYIFMGHGVPYYLYSDSGGIYTHEHSWFSGPYFADP
ncbi:MAG: WG repeat-containing protein [Bacteroidota bacterium]|nr:WG repeat-containing protein [Bacteroidota bacterium]